MASLEKHTWYAVPGIRRSVHTLGVTKYDASGYIQVCIQPYDRKQKVVFGGVFQSTMHYGWGFQA